MTLDEPGGAKAAAAVLPGSSSATAAHRGAPDVDDMRETRSYFHELDLEQVEWEDHNIRWQTAPLGEDQA